MRRDLHGDGAALSEIERRTEPRRVERGASEGTTVASPSESLESSVARSIRGTTSAAPNVMPSGSRRRGSSWAAPSFVCSKTMDTDSRREHRLVLRGD
ncbi:hypothetical protein AKJ09_10654 [Labilithrix luteola]|uniref:Uncharacterized protein n=1 Tax=Labilithrix luteola TaxID=1391654 RepID=A0A0K1QDZ3_9BACT|nr:hypothetical protein AKJ09_10654 [Labilithrix luteola]